MLVFAAVEGQPQPRPAKPAPVEVVEDRYFLVGSFNRRGIPGITAGNQRGPLTDGRLTGSEVMIWLVVWNSFIFHTLGIIIPTD